MDKSADIGVAEGVRTRVGSMLHDRKHFAYFPFRSRTLQPTYRQLSNDLLSLSYIRVYSTGLQLAKIDRVKVHDSADRIGLLLCVSGDARYRPLFYTAPFAPFVIITRNCWLFLIYISRYILASCFIIAEVLMIVCAMTIYKIMTKKCSKFFINQSFKEWY